ncbi:hypothetical protein [Vulcanisaeta thermophila]|uniref:hypothetical protein n=1 Tax=Vulcanisaeta thermophila TaxID=867917 RepID=UPI000853A9E1|nr:hypothetical protein [Vulcanisaeta thermophila]
MDGIMLVNAKYMPGNKAISVHKQSVCPFRNCNFLLGPLGNVRFVVRIIGADARPVITIQRFND